MARRRLLLLLVVVALFASMSASGAATITVDVKDYGAKGNGVDDDTKVGGLEQLSSSPIHASILVLLILIISEQ
jgi:hypothetical protein